MATLRGTNGNNTLTDKSADRLSYIYGLAGNDTLYGGVGVDYLYGDAGNDWLVGDAGKDFLDGGAGIDGASFINSLSGVNVALDNSFARSANAADHLKSIEKIQGTQYNDRLAGNSGSNTINGMRGIDTIYGRAGVDRLLGGDGNDTLRGEAGDDTLYGEAGRDVLDGGAGNDVASYYYGAGVTVALDGSLTVLGAAIGDSFVSIERVEGSRTGSDKISGNAADNVLWGVGGNDRLFGRAGGDTLYGGDGNDNLSGGEGDDFLHGEKGADILSGGNGEDQASYYFSAAGVTASLDGSLLAKGDAVGDKFSSIETLGGSNTGNDILSGNELNNTIWGNGGNDVLYGRDGDDLLYGYTGSDKIYGGNGADELWGGAGKDYLNGGAGADYAIYFDSTGVNLAIDGSFARKGEAVNDTLVSIENIAGSETGADRLAGNAGKNELWGDGGNDILFGRAGNDILHGNAGNDRLSGEAGNDTFVFHKTTDGVDVITDFASGDKIEIRTSGFAGQTVGSLAENQFQAGIGHVAGTADIRFIFDSSNNGLWFDSDGDGGAAAVNIAILSNGYSLSHLDFTLT